MIGSVEELERDIELFQNNLAASNEMVDLLRKIISEIKESEKNISEQSDRLFKKISDSPDDIGKKVEDINSEGRRKLLDDTEVIVKSFDNKIDRISNESQKIIDFTENVVKKLSETPDEIGTKVNEENEKNRNCINEDLAQFVEKIDLIIKGYNDSVAKFDNDLSKVIASMKEVEEKNELTQKRISEMERNYEDILHRMDSMHIERIYESNQRLEKNINTKSLIIIIIAILSVVMGIIGIII